VNGKEVENVMKADLRTLNGHSLIRSTGG